MALGIIDEANNSYMWNPWHGCHKCSTGCYHCYMYEQDRNFGIDSNIVKLNKAAFRLPVQKFKVKERNGVKIEKYELEYKIPNGSIVNTCLTSDFFIGEADVWRQEAWEYIKERNTCLFKIITKRPHRINQCLSYNWLYGGTYGWNNVHVAVSVENEEMAWERIPLLLNSYVRHKSIMVAPMLEYIDLSPFLSSGEIESVSVGGESFNGLGSKARILELAWVHEIAKQCDTYDVSFNFHQTGTRLKLIDSRVVQVNKRDEAELASFYKLNKDSTDSIDWHTSAKEIELQELAENASRIYKQLTLSDYIK